MRGVSALIGGKRETRYFRARSIWYDWSTTWNGVVWLVEEKKEVRARSYLSGQGFVERVFWLVERYKCISCPNVSDWSKTLKRGVSLVKGRNIFRARRNGIGQQQWRVDLIGGREKYISCLHSYDWSTSKVWCCWWKIIAVIRDVPTGMGRKRGVVCWRRRGGGGYNFELRCQELDKLRGGESRFRLVPCFGRYQRARVLSVKSWPLFLFI